MAPTKKNSNKPAPKARSAARDKTTTKHRNPASPATTASTSKMSTPSSHSTLSTTSKKRGASSKASSESSKKNVRRTIEFSDAVSTPDTSALGKTKKKPSKPSKPSKLKPSKPVAKSLILDDDYLLRDATELDFRNPDVLIELIKHQNGEDCDIPADHAEMVVMATRVYEPRDLRLACAVMMTKAGDDKPKPPRTRKPLENLFVDLIVHGKNMNSKVGQLKQAPVPDEVELKGPFDKFDKSMTINDIMEKFEDEVIYYLTFLYEDNTTKTFDLDIPKQNKQACAAVLKGRNSKKVKGWYGHVMEDFNEECDEEMDISDTEQKSEESEAEEEHASANGNGNDEEESGGVEDEEEEEDSEQEGEEEEGEGGEDEEAEEEGDVADATEAEESEEEEVYDYCVDEDEEPADEGDDKDEEEAEEQADTEGVEDMDIDDDGSLPPLLDRDDCSVDSSSSIESVTGDVSAKNKGAKVAKRKNGGRKGKAGKGRGKKNSRAKARRKNLTSTKNAGKKTPKKTATSTSSVEAETVVKKSEVAKTTEKKGKDEEDIIEDALFAGTLEALQNTGVTSVQTLNAYISTGFVNKKEKTKVWIVTLGDLRYIYYLKAAFLQLALGTAFKNRVVEGEKAWFQNFFEINIRKVEHGEGEDGLYKRKAPTSKNARGNTHSRICFALCVPLDDLKSFKTRLDDALNKLFRFLRKRKNSTAGKCAMGYFSKFMPGLYKSVTTKFGGEESAIRAMNDQFDDMFAGDPNIIFDVELDKLMVDSDIKKFLEDYVGHSSWETVPERERKYIYKNYPTRALPRWGDIRKEEY